MLNVTLFIAFSMSYLLQGIVMMQAKDYFRQSWSVDSIYTRVLVLASMVCMLFHQVLFAVAVYMNHVPTAILWMSCVSAKLFSFCSQTFFVIRVYFLPWRFDLVFIPLIFLLVGSFATLLGLPFAPAGTDALHRLQILADIFPLILNIWTAACILGHLCSVKSIHRSLTDAILHAALPGTILLLLALFGSIFHVEGNDPSGGAVAGLAGFAQAMCMMWVLQSRPCLRNEAPLESKGTDDSASRLMRDLAWTKKQHFSVSPSVPVRATLLPLHVSTENNHPIFKNFESRTSQDTMGSYPSSSKDATTARTLTSPVGMHARSLSSSSNSRQGSLSRVTREDPIVPHISQIPTVSNMPMAMRMQSTSRVGAFPASPKDSFAISEGEDTGTIPITFGGNDNGTLVSDTLPRSPTITLSRSGSRATTSTVLKYPLPPRSHPYARTELVNKNDYQLPRANSATIPMHMAFVGATTPTFSSPIALQTSCQTILPTTPKSIISPVSSCSSMNSPVRPAHSPIGRSLSGKRRILPKRPPVPPFAPPDPRPDSPFNSSSSPTSIRLLHSL